jgi:hypothetical protein
MFNQLFFRSDALTRQLSAPLVYERGQYLNHWATLGMSRRTLREKARLLLFIEECLRLDQRASGPASADNVGIHSTPTGFAPDAGISGRSLVVSSVEQRLRT